MSIQSIGGGVINTGNKIQRAEERVVNNGRAAIATAATVGVAGAAIYGASKIKPKYYAKVINPITKGIRNVAAMTLKKVGNKKGFINKVAAKTAKVAGKIATALKNNPKTTVIGGLIAGGAIALNAILNNRAYTAGKIDQKYDDRELIQNMNLYA